MQLAASHADAETNCEKWQRCDQVFCETASAHFPLQATGTLLTANFDTKTRRSAIGMKRNPALHEHPESLPPNPHHSRTLNDPLSRSLYRLELRLPSAAARRLLAWRAIDQETNFILDLATYSYRQIRGFDSKIPLDLKPCSGFKVVLCRFCAWPMEALCKVVINEKEGT